VTSESYWWYLQIYFIAVIYFKMVVILGNEAHGGAMLRRYFPLYILFFGFLFLTGCARYKAKPLGKAVAQVTDRQKRVVPLICAYHVFTKDDCKRYLDRNVLAKGYQPILLTFTNNTKRCFKILRENISLPTVPATQVVRRVHTSTLGRALGYGAVGIVMWPFLISAVVDGIESSQANSRLDQDFARKELTEHIVGPFSTYSGLIFVPKEKFSWNFTIGVSDAMTGRMFALHTDACCTGGSYESVE
jgi:hypothetical protein